MYRYLIVVEKAGRNYSAYAPDLPGCVATGNTREEAEANIRDAIEMHLSGLIEDHASIPEPQASAEYIDIKAPADAVEN
nr:type II toxin-antitoxin system HicB family antitoxin [Candidatus Sigynarchaeum springense]